MKLEKKHYIAGAIGVVTVAGALAYLQYKRMMDYAIKVKNVSLKKASLSLISMDLTLDYINKGNIDVNVDKKIVNVYINDKFVTKIESVEPFTIKADSTSPFKLNVEFNPNDVLSMLKLNAVDIAVNPQKVNIRLDLTLKAKLWFFKVNIKDKYTFNLKELLTKKE